MGTPSSSTSIAPTRFPSHQLSNGLYVSGHPDQLKDKSPTMSVPQIPYTGGDIKKSGELGKMFDIPVDSSSSAKSRKSAMPLKASSSHSGPLPSQGSLQSAGLQSGRFSSTMSSGISKSGPHVSKSGPLLGNKSATGKESSKSGPLTRSVSGDPSGSGASRKFPGTVSLQSASVLSSVSTGTGGGSVGKTSGQLAPALPATGLITSGPLSSGSLTPPGLHRKGHSGPMEASVAPGKLSTGAGANSQAINNLSHDQEFSSRRSFPRVIWWTVIPLFVMGFIAGAFIIAAVQNAILLIIVAGLFGAFAVLFLWNRFWKQRSVKGFLDGFPDSELGTAKDGQFVKITGRHVVDFYISDLQSGLRALVKAGYGARLITHVEESSVLDITPKSKEVPPDFLCWLSERNLSTSERAMRLKEGYIKEGSSVTVLGVVQRHDNVLMIVPPPEAVSTGCQWSKFSFPTNLDSLIVTCHDTTKNNGIPL